jgi:tetraacyldisaccharide 4'-kinase
LIDKISLWGERYLFTPKGLDYLLALLLLPLSLFYTLVMYIRFITTTVTSFNIPIVSVGNLVIGGSGKTPVTIALASQYKNAAVVLRGYGRNSQGTIVVSDGESILEDVTVSGDEAMLLAKKLPSTIIIVATDRVEGIDKAKEMGAKVLFLDDGYSKHFIKKLDLILEPNQRNYLPLCIPSGPMREKLWWGKKALVLQEDRDFSRKVTVCDATNMMLLVTAISKPWRLDKYLPEVVGKEYFIDHYSFKKEELVSLMQNYNATSILTTQKDAVKMQKFDLPLSILDLDLHISDTMSQKIDNYIKEN